MAKTYEAILMSQRSPNGDPVAILADPQLAFLDLAHTEALATLGQNVSLFQNKNGHRVFLFLSSREKEGVSTLVVNLAKFMAGAESVKKILLIDANQNSPVLHLAFSVALQPGLNDILGKRCSHHEAINKLPGTGISFIPNGTPLTNGSIGLEHDRFGQFLSLLKDQYDCILIDSLPLLDSPEALSLARASDVILFVIQANRIQWEVAERAKLQLERNDCFIGGVVLNRMLHVIPGWIYKRL